MSTFNSNLLLKTANGSCMLTADWAIITAYSISLCGRRVSVSMIMFLLFADIHRRSLLRITPAEFTQSERREAQFLGLAIKK